jgi:hypothetical protein
MTRALENRLEQLFAEADTDLPAEVFTAKVMSELRKQRRRQLLLWSSSVLAGLVFLWFSFSSFEPALRTVAEYPSIALDLVAESLVALSQSPLVYVYGTALGGYLLLGLMRRFHIRLM